MHQDRPAVIARSDARGIAIAIAIVLCGLALLAPARALAVTPQPAPGTWSPTGPMLDIQRGESTATRMPDGRVLVAGGVGDLNGAAATTDVYDPATNDWTNGGCLNDEREGPSELSLADGRVLILGGNCDNRGVSTAEIYDPATGRFVPTTAPADGGPAVLLHDGRVLTVGVSSSEVFDPAATDPKTGLKGRWTPSGFIHIPLTNGGASLTTLQDGRVLLAGGASGGPFATDNAELWDPVTGLWTQTGKLVTSRFTAVATLLQDGRVLLAGGFHEDVGFVNRTALSSAEIYDPATGTWTATGSMNGLRDQAGGTLLANGKVLMVGGNDGLGHDLLSADLFDPATGTWTATANAPTQVHTSGLVLPLLDGRVMAFGGRGFSDNEIYDPVADSWSAGAPPTFHYAASSGALLPDGKVLIRGANEFFDPLANAAELYDPGADHWTPFGPRATGRRSASATLLGNGKVLIAGGIAHNGGGTLATAELYDPVSGISAETGSMTTARSNQTATLLASGKVLVAGGLDASGTPLGSAELYDPVSGTWSAAGALGARSQHTANLLPGGDVLVVGGIDGAGNALDSAERYDPGANAWSAVASVPDARAQHTATTLADGRVLVAGGHDSAGKVLDSVAIFGADGTWTAAKPLAQARTNHAAMLVPGGDVIVAGGTGGTGSDLRSVERYDPVGGTWRATESLSRPRTAPTATLLADGRVLVTGGTLDNSAEVYDPGAPPKGSFLETGSPQFSGYGSQTLLANGKVLLAGGGADGQRVELFNPLSGRWSPAAPLPAPQPGHVAVRLADGRVLLAGGPNGESAIYDPAANHWTVAGSMTVPRAGAVAALLGDGRVLVVGGRPNPNAGVSVDPTAEVFNPATGGWTTTVSSAIPRGQDASTATALTSPGCADKCGQVLLAGGPFPGSNQLLELYNPATDTFTSPGSLSASRTDAKATRMRDGRILISSGGSAEIYDPAQPDTSATFPMKDRRRSNGQALVGDGTVLEAGGIADGSLAEIAASELYDPATNRWRFSGNMKTPRQGAFVTSLATRPYSVCGENCGKVLVSGGVRFDPFPTKVDVTTAEIFTPQPKVTGIDVGQGPLSGGTVVTITGSGLAAAGNVLFGDTQAASFVPDEDSPGTTLRVVAPAHSAGSVDIRVATAGGTSDTSAADRFAYVAEAVPGAAAPPPPPPPPPPAAPAAARDRTAPVISALRLSHSRFRRAPGATITFKLSERAKVTLSFARVVPCRKPRHGCTRLVNVSPALAVSGRKGSNRVAFHGRLSARRTLSPGHYEITARATDAAGNRSAGRTARFVLLR